MGGKKRKNRAAKWLAALIGLICAVILAMLFYGAMVYQTAEGGENDPLGAPSATMAPLEQGMSTAQLFPGPLLSLAGGTLEQETAQDIEIDGALCRVVTRSYVFEDGRGARALSAYPAAYLRRMALEGYTPQLIMGFTVAGLEAVYELRGEDALLAAREGDFVYMIEAAADEAAMYALGAGSALEAQ